MNGQLRGLAKPRCITHIRHMLNLFSILFGILSLIIVIPSTIPFLGWGNWFALPLIAIGVGLGALSRTNSGRNFCLIVLLIAVVRLSMGGGIF